MSGREKQTRQASMAILALPVCTTLEMGFGVLFGAAAGDVSKGISLGLIGGAGVGNAAFGLLYAWMSRRQLLREEQDGRHLRD